MVFNLCFFYESENVKTNIKYVGIFIIINKYLLKIRITKYKTVVDVILLIYYVPSNHQFLMTSDEPSD